MSDHIGKGRSPWRERAVWIAVSASFLALAVAAFTLAEPAQAQSGGKTESSRYMSIIQNVFTFIQNNYVDDVEAKKLYEGAMKGMLEVLGDPYSQYLDEVAMKDLSDTTSGKFGGVGLIISKQAASLDPAKVARPLYIEVVSPIEDTPGWKAGLLPGDLIIKVEDESTEKFTVEDAVKRLRGAPGTEVKIVVRRSEELEFPVTLKRALVEVPTVKREMMPGGVGYLRIIEFTPSTAARVKEAVDYFKSKDYKSLVIDLRNDPGGLLSAVVDVADLFLDSGVIVSTKSRIPEENAVYKADSALYVPKDMPVVVLINKGSASASEILAGALKDQHRAYLVGETSYGKGSVQQIYNLSTSTGFKLTMSRYYTPSDVNIDKVGIKPDLVSKAPELTDEEVASLKKLLAENAVADFVKSRPYPTPSEIASFVEGLRRGGVKLDAKLLSRMVRDEANRKSVAPVFDLEYDTALQAAAGILGDGSWAPLMRTQLTLKEEMDRAKGPSASGGPTAAAPALPLPAPPAGK